MNMKDFSSMLCESKNGDPNFTIEDMYKKLTGKSTNKKTGRFLIGKDIVHKKVPKIIDEMDKMFFGEEEIAEARDKEVDLAAQYHVEKLGKDTAYPNQFCFTIDFTGELENYDYDEDDEDNEEFYPMHGDFTFFIDKDLNIIDSAVSTT